MKWITWTTFPREITGSFGTTRSYVVHNGSGLGNCSWEIVGKDHCTWGMGTSYSKMAAPPVKMHTLNTDARGYPFVSVKLTGLPIRIGGKFGIWILA